MYIDWLTAMRIVRRANRDRALKDLNDDVHEWHRAESERRQAEEKKAQEDAELKRAETQAIIDMAAYLRNKKI